MKNMIISLSLVLLISGLCACENSNDVTAPEGLSKEEVFAALYNNAKPLGLGFLDPNCLEDIDLSTEAKEVLKESCYRDYCDYVRGRCVKVGFSNFPKLNCRLYNREYGENACKEVIDKLSEDKFSKKKNKK